VATTHHKWNFIAVHHIASFSKCSDCSHKYWDFQLSACYIVSCIEQCEIKPGP